MIIYFPTSSGVSVSDRFEQTCAAERASGAEQVNEQEVRENGRARERTSEWTSKWPSTYVWVHGYFQPQCHTISSF